MMFNPTTEKTATKSLRERFLTQKLAQVEFALATRQDELQIQIQRGLSPAKLDQKQFELDALRDLKSNLLDGLETVARQNYAVSAPRFEADDADEQPVGGFRSQRAYLDALQRERARLAPLSRDQWDRATLQAPAAKRSRTKIPKGRDIDPDTLFARAHPSWYTQPGHVRSYMFAKETLTGIDPCLDAKRVRREVMFAQRTAGIGYRTRHEWKPC